VPAAVVDDATLGGKFNRALLLVLGALDEISIAENLQLDQSEADGAAPEN